MNRVFRSAAAALVFAGVAACGDNTAPQPQEGTVELSLTSPTAEDGALLLTIRGPVVGDVTRARDDLLVFGYRAEPEVWRVAVFGNGLNGALLRLTVPDITQTDAYTFTVDEVAGRDGELRPGLEGYRLALAP